MSRGVFILMAHDPDAGAAVRPVGVLGLAGEESHVSWVPYEPAAEMWQARLAAASVPLGQAVKRWAGEADGVAWDLVEIEASQADDLASAVEATLDALLAPAGAGEGLS